MHRSFQQSLEQRNRSPPRLTSDPFNLAHTISSAKCGLRSKESKRRSRENCSRYIRRTPSAYVCAAQLLIQPYWNGYAGRPCAYLPNQKQDSVFPYRCRSRLLTSSRKEVDKARNWGLPEIPVKVHLRNSALSQQGCDTTYRVLYQFHSSVLTTNRRLCFA